MKDYVYQLVIEFEGDALDNYDRVIALEVDLRGALKDALVDGHDVGPLK